MAILNPMPGSPSKFSLLTVQSSKFKVQVDEPRIPSLSSFLPNDRPEKCLNFSNHRYQRTYHVSLSPGHGFGTRKALIPLCFFDLSVVAKTTAASASYPLVIQHLAPFNS